MPLRITSAPVSGIKKRKSATTPPNRRAASPFTSHARLKSSVRGNAAQKSSLVLTSTADYDNGQHGYPNDDSEPLPDVGSSSYLTESVNLHHDSSGGVLQAIQHVKTTMFEELPERRTGMNSKRIAELLNARRSLPPMLSAAHIHTVLQAPTQVEREIVSLVRSGQLKRLIVPGRGQGAAGLGDCVVLASDLRELVQTSSDLSQDLKDRFLDVLDRMADTSAIPALAFSHEESIALVRAGFLVTASSLSKDTVNLTSSHSYDPSKACEFRPDSIQSRAPAFFLSLPNTGPYLRLLSAARAHFLSLLKQSKYHEAPLTLLRDRWDGAVESDRSYSVAKRIRGEFSGVLPGRTKKWKEFNGVSFQWILEETLGAGLVELFDTGSVGPGIRCV